MFTPEELAEIAAADAEIEASFSLTCQDIRESKQRDKQALFDRKDRKGQIKSAQKREYREINRDKISAQKREYYEANRGRHAEVGILLRKKRKEAGLRQKDVAEAIGVSCSMISIWETGRQPPDMPRLEKVLPGIIDAMERMAAK